MYMVLLKDFLVASTKSADFIASGIADTHFLMTSSGVPRGAKKPNLVTSTMSRPPSRTVMKFGISSERCGPVSARATSLPAFTCGMMALGRPTTMSTLPPRMDVTAGPMP